jgi:hypothetical protein
MYSSMNSYFLLTHFLQTQKQNFLNLHITKLEMLCQKISLLKQISKKKAGDVREQGGNFRTQSNIWITCDSFVSKLEFQELQKNFFFL